MYKNNYKKHFAALDVPFAFDALIIFGLKNDPPYMERDITGDKFFFSSQS